jgi:hypothetical protein
MTAGCAGTLPEPVYANQVEAFFPEAEAQDAPDAEAHHRLRVSAGHCAARLNGHRDTAESVSIVQGIISGIGGATGGVGGALSVVHFSSTDINTAMGVMGSIGAAITVVGNFVLSLVANPLEELRRHDLGLRSWELAIELALAHGDADAIDQSLTRCAADEAPPSHLAGEGAAYSE